MDFFKKILGEYGISGKEGNIRKVIIEELKELSLDISVDNIGNLIVKKINNKNEGSIALCAHMDEVGFIVTEILSDDLIRIEPIGGTNCRYLHGKRVVVGNQKKEGTIWIEQLQYHYSENYKRSDREVARNICVYLDLKCNDISLGDYVFFKENYKFLGGKLVSSKALDDRAGCYIIVNLLKRIKNKNLIAYFTVQEETGLYGSQYLDIDETIEELIVIDCTPVDKSRMLNLGGGPIINISDRFAMYNRIYYKKIIKFANEISIPIQIKNEENGATDAANINKKGIIKNIASIGVPCKLIHTSNTLINMDDMHKTEDMIYFYIENKVGERINI